ncbi:Protein kinase [Coemansia sp. RSA 1365]|nr:Protein kinase [Coemansia sp. RSA 1365]
MTSKQKIGNYTVLRTIGVGSFGKVKLAVHAQTGHKVALKIIGRNKLAHSDMVGRVNREIQYLKMLRHPHIIKLYEVITTATDIIMAIEYAGGELFNYIVERGRMSEGDARRFFQQLVSAVEYCHRRNIVHRDLKPENVLLDPHDNVKVADFGLSNIMKDGEFLQTSCGSPNYAAPEVINGKLYAGPEVDAWSCGVILYVMLCGRLPFDDDHIPALFKKITAGVFSMPGYLSSGARAVLAGLLQVDPLKRMTLGQVRQHAWFTMDLPEYLRPLPASTDIEGLERLDETIVSALELQLEMDRRSLVAQLRQQGTNPAKVAYQLTLDNRHVLEQSRNAPTQGIRDFALASSPPVTLHGGMLTAASAGMHSATSAAEDTAPSGIGVLGSSLPHTAGLALESQLHRMRLRGPQGQQQSLPGATTAAPTAKRGTSNGTATPPNYFRAALPPLNASSGASASSSVASLAHASLKTSTLGGNPYNHRETEGATDKGAADSITNGGTADSALSDTTAAAARKPTVMRKRAKTTRTRWHFGIRSRSPPADVMAEVYRALRQLQMTWKHFTPFHLRARYAPEGGTEVKIDLQLFKLDSRDNYLVDFKAVLPPPRTDAGDGPGYRAGRNTLISPLPQFIQAARRRMSAVDVPPSLDNQFLDADYPIQLPAEVSQPSAPAGVVDSADRSDMLPRPDALPARPMPRRVLASGDDDMAIDTPADAMSVGSTSSASIPSRGATGIPIPSSAAQASPSRNAAGIPIPTPSAQAIPSHSAAAASPSHMFGGTPRSQGRLPGSYMPGSVVGRVALARADVSLTADGVGAGSGPAQQAHERVINIFPFFDVCCRLITELAVPSTTTA